MTCLKPVTGTTIFGARSVASTTDYGNPTVIYKGPPAIEDAVGWISNPDHVPNADGLYIPFIRPLFHFDSKTVPEVIEMFFMKCLGDTTEDIIMTYRDIVSAWGNIWKSEIGIMLSVIALAIKVGLTAQARILPLFGGDRFLGVILSGSGFTIELEQVAYRPVPFASLVSVIKSSDPHVDALNQIAQLLGTDPAKVAVRKAKTMAELRAILRGTWTIENNTELLMKQAARLNFQEPSWNINSTTLDRALTLISHGNLPLTGIPIHYTMLLEEKRSHVVWSCFGGMAPSFRIPNSRPLSLEGAMEVAFRGKDGSKQKPVPVTKVACRSAVLEIALRDLDEMIRKKEILNPFGSPNQRASQMNLDRFFSGDEAKKIVAGLRGICGVTGADLAMVKRKAREDTGEEPTRKRPAGFDDF